MGRPSTYAPILETLKKRYIENPQKNPRALAPTLTAFVVIQLLEKYFPGVID